ncbi:pectinesterase inhibitor 12-like [Phragmites australis]|uniref:pectinesterase inhibitor 12-like n=1 Tax=Phragmites australis TaxID=29695 RepID=UPI002D78EA13|nr:pectinesterase inhibitor 12-like [Phragmites australis]
MEMTGDCVFTTSLCLAILLLVSINAPAQAAEFAPTEECANPVSVETACHGASETHSAVAYEHCVASLAADPRSKEAGDMHGLAVLATKLAIDHAASTESKIDDLAELEDSPQARARFNHCLDQYGGAADLLRDALDNLQSHIYGKAIEQLAAALGASESCEDAWKGEERIPVAGHDREYGRMAHIALGFTHAAA